MIIMILFECSKLESLHDISNWNIKNITKLFGLFQECTSLK